MPRQRNLLPSYLLHKQSGRARAVWTDPAGTRQFRLLPGLFDNAESRTAFARLQLELASSPHLPYKADRSGVSVNEVLLAYLGFAQGHYRRPDGSTSNEFEEYKLVARYVRELYGHLPSAEFGPLALRAVRQKFLAADWSRGFINQRIWRVKRIFKWAVAEELIPSAVHQALTAVPGLQRGRSAARETEPVGPVDDATVDATLPFLSAHVRGLVEFQRLTGCRPGEACALRRCDIDTGGAVWLYRPTLHKNTWRGKSRTIAIGPKAQAMLREYFTPSIDDYLFSPARAVKQLIAERNAKRKTPRWPSHMKRNERKRVGAKRKRPPAERYNRLSYGTAIDRACDRAFPPPAHVAQLGGESVAKWWRRLIDGQKAEVKAWRKAHRWHPNQLRHSYATRVRREHGLEAAQVLLGHSRADVTQVYAERDVGLAVAVAAKIG